MNLLRVRTTSLAILVGLTGTALAGALADTGNEVVVQTIRAQIAGASTQTAKPTGTRLTFSLKTKLASNQRAKLRIVGTRSQKIRVRSSRSKTVVSGSLRKGKAVEIGVTPLMKGVRGTVVFTISDANGRPPAIERGSRRPRVVITQIRTAPTPVPPLPTPPPTPTGDIVAPSAPGAPSATTATRNNILVNWAAATDNVGVTGYVVSRGGVQVATPTGASQTVDGLDCGTAYAIGVRAKDAAGNLGPAVTASLSTAACPVVMSVGDIACAPVGAVTCRQADVAGIVSAQNPDAFINLGDAQYDDWGSGTSNNYTAAFGALFAKTYAVQGNHDFDSGGGLPAANATGNNWYSYFTPAHAGPAYGKAWSVDIGTWHMVFLNSNCNTVTTGIDSCAAQNIWLEADLAAATARKTSCVLAAWHHPRWVPGAATEGASYVDNPLSSQWIATLYAHGADVVLGSHSHHYERLRPLNPSGVVDEANGLRTFVIGTGGRDIRGTNLSALPPLTAAASNSFGSLRLNLKAKSFESAFITSTGATFDASPAPIDCRTKS